MNKTIRLPAEWEQHEAIALSWPHNPRTWPGHVEDVRTIYLNFIREITESEDLWLLVGSAQAEIDVRRRLTLAGVSDKRVQTFVMPTNDSWIRDYGPITVYQESAGKRERVLLDWQFNGWGGKYDYCENYGNDDEVPSELARRLQIKSQKIPFILEGGSIDANGAGTLLTSVSCLLNDNRDAARNRNVVEEMFAQKLGIRKTIWVDDGIAGDDTDGHIDDTARFVSTDTVVCMREDNTSDENHAPLKAIYNTLRNSNDQNGKPLLVATLPMPDPITNDGERLPASYANFLITNDKVLVPVFKCKQDEVALAILRELFPRRQVVGIDARAAVIGFGSLHCLSQQIPVK